MPAAIDAPPPLFIPTDDGAPGAPIDADHPFTRAAWIVDANVVGIARRSARVDIPPAGAVPALSFAVSRFEPRTGFSVDEAGNLIVDDDPRKVGYFWYGRNGRNHLFLTVHEGNVHAMVYGPGLRLGMRAEPEGLVLRELDAAAVDARGCATESPRLAAFHVMAGGAESSTVWAPTATPHRRDDSLAASTRRPKHSARIGVMIYYTNAALTLYPDIDPANPPLSRMQSTTRALINELNQVLISSGDSYYIQFEQIGSLTPMGTYNGSPQFTDPNIRFSTGHLLALRNFDRSIAGRATQGADFAVLLVKDDGDPSPPPPAQPRPVWGVAIVQRNNCLSSPSCEVGDGNFPVPGSASYREFAYGVVSIAPSAQNLTFAHEIGHMLGAAHDVNVQYPSGQLPAFPISYGYRVPTVARDVMADPRCIDTNGDGSLDQCTDRSPQFANPRVSFTSTAVPAGTTAQNDVVRSHGCLAEPSGNLYPLGGSQTVPDLFWGGFEAPGTTVSSCPTRIDW